MLAAGERDFRILLVGDGSEREWLQANLQHATFPGFLQGDELAAAFASMDAFVFPSRTGTFGLVILEAMASGVPVVLGGEAGNRVGIQQGVNGLLCDDLADGVLSLMRCETMRQSLSAAAERFAQAHRGNGVFDGLYEAYAVALASAEVGCRIKLNALLTV